jgi:hypothetical protein
MSIKQQTAFWGELEAMAKLDDPQQQSSHHNISGSDHSPCGVGID